MPSGVNEPNQYTARRMLVSRGLLIVLGIVCLMVGVATLYFVGGDKSWLSVVFLIVGIVYLAVACFANDRVARIVSFLWP